MVYVYGIVLTTKKNDHLIINKSMTMIVGCSLWETLPQLAGYEAIPAEVKQHISVTL